MARPDKVAAVDEVAGSLSSNAATLLTDYRGLTVTELAELRARLREANASYQVVKNTLTRRAAADAGIPGLDEFLTGPTALVFCEDDPVGPMKAIRDFMKDHPELLVKAGWVEGEILDDQATMKLAELASRDDLISELAGLLYGALANFARLLQAPLEHQARLVKALEDAGGPAAKGFEVEEPAAEAAETAAEAEEPVAEAEEPAAAEEESADEDAEDASESDAPASDETESDETAAGADEAASDESADADDTTTS